MILLSNENNVFSVCLTPPCNLDIVNSHHHHDHDHICLQCLLNPAVRSVAGRRAAPLLAALGLGSKRGDDNNDDN